MSEAQSILSSAPSTLSGNTVTVEITDDGRLEVTLEAHDGSVSWGEGLSYEDTLYVAERMARWWAETTRARRG